MRGIKRSYSRQVHEKERNEDDRYTIKVTFFFLSLINCVNTTHYMKRHVYQRRSVHLVSRGGFRGRKKREISRIGLGGA